MPKQVVNTALLKCSFGLAPSPLTVLPVNRVLCFNQPAANIMDHKPMMNIMPFGMCTTQSNPTVAAATAAAMGTPTPSACIPATVAPWAPGAPMTKIANFPALDDASTCQCTYGGVIQVTFAGQATTDVA